MPEFQRRLDEIERQINELLQMVEIVKYSDPETALIKARKACEAICREVCLREGLIEDSKKGRATSFDAMIGLIAEREMAPRAILVDMRTVQLKGNVAVHSPESLTPADARPALAALANITT